MASARHPSAVQKSNPPLYPLRRPLLWEQRSTFSNKRYQCVPATAYNEIVRPLRRPLPLLLRSCYILASPPSKQQDLDDGYLRLPDSGNRRSHVTPLNDMNITTDNPDEGVGFGERTSGDHPASAVRLREEGLRAWSEYQKARYPMAQAICRFKH